jgi:hypothetical protein
VPDLRREKARGARCWPEVYLLGWIPPNEQVSLEAARLADGMACGVTYVSLWWH